MKNNIILVSDEIKKLRDFAKVMRKKFNKERLPYDIIIGTAFWKACAQYQKNFNRTQEYYAFLSVLMDMELNTKRQFIIIFDKPNEINLYCGMEFLYEDYNSLSRRPIISRTKVFYCSLEDENLVIQLLVERMNGDEKSLSDEIIFVENEKDLKSFERMEPNKFYEIRKK